MITREIDVLDKAHKAAAPKKKKGNQAAHATAELKEETAAAAHTAQEKVDDVAHDVKGLSLPRARISSSIQPVSDLPEKAVNVEHAAEEKAAEIKHDADKKAGELAHSAQGRAIITLWSCFHERFSI